MGSGHDENLCFEVIDALINKYKASIAPPPSAPVPAVGAASPNPAAAPGAAPAPPAPPPTNP